MNDGHTEQVTRAKPAPPDAGGLIARPRLFERLDQAYKGSVTMVVAPGGSGKTSLVASWLQARQAEPVAWYTLDETDRDSLHCLEGICAAIERVYPGACAAPLAALAAGERDPAIVAALVQALEDRPLTLVLDDFHALDGAAELAEPLDRLCRYAPPATSVIVVSRTLPQLTYTWLIAFRGMTAVTAGDLRFDGGDGTALLAAHGLPAAEAEQLAARSDGWAAGLLLLARTGTSTLDVHGDGEEPGSQALEVLTARRHAAFALLAAELLVALPQDLRTFALESATVCPATCAQVAELLGRGDAPAAFAALRQRGFFVAEDGEGVMRYHDLLAECLLAGHAAAAPPRHRELRRRRAMLYVQLGDLEQAAALLRGDGAWEELIELLYSHLNAFYARRSYATIAACIEALPPALRTADLMARCGEARLRLGQFAGGLTWADAALSAADDPVVVVRALLLRANVLDEAGRYVEVPPLTRECTRLAESLHDPALRARAIAVAADAEGFVLLKLGDRQRGEAKLAEAEAYYAGADARWDQGRVLTNRAIGLVEAGWGQEAIVQVDRALPLLREIGDTARVAFCDYVRALALELSEGPAAAQPWLREAMEALGRAGKVCAACIAQGELARALVEVGETAQGLTLAEQALQSAIRLEDEDAWRAAQRALIAAAIARKRTVEARAAIALVRQSSVPPPELAELDYLEGYCELRGRNYRAAARRLAQAAGELAALDRPHLAARALLLRGEAQLARGFENPAGAAINAAAALAAARHCEGYLAPLARYARTVIGTRRSLLTLNAAGRALLQRLGQAAPLGEGADPAADTRPRLDVHPFGTGVVCLDEVRLDLGALRPKTRELLYFLAERGGRVSREDAMEALWPDAAQCRRNSLERAVHWLRCLLGDSCLPAYRHNLELHAEVHDAGRALLALADEACAAHEAGDLPRAAACLARASAYLGGEPYLPWCASAWAAEVRGRYAEAAQRLADIDAAMGAARNADATDAPQICLAGRVAQAGTAGSSA